MRKHIVLGLIFLVFISQIHLTDYNTNNSTDQAEPSSGFNISDDSSEYFDAIVRNSLINGTILIDGESKVRFENVSLLNSIVIVRGNAKLEIVNSSASYFMAYITGNGELQLRNFTTDNGRIFVGGNGLLVVDNGFNSSYTYLEAYGRSRIRIYREVYGTVSIVVGNMTRLYMEHIKGSDEDDGGLDLTLYGDSFASLYDFNNKNFSNIRAFDSSQAILSTLNADSVYLYDNASIVTNDTNIGSMEAYGGSNLIVVASNISNFENDYVGVNGYFSWTNITFMNLMSQSIVNLSHCDIQTLQFLNVFNDTLIIDSSGWAYSYKYVNYINTSSTADTIINMTDSTIMVVDAPQFQFSDDMTISSLIIMDVRDTEITDSNIMVHSSIYVENTTINIAKTNISAADSSYSLTVVNSIGFVVNSNINETFARIENSDIEFINSTLNWTPGIGDGIYLVRSRLFLNSSVIDSNVIIDTIRVEDGTFTFEDGIIRTISGDVIYGIEGYGEAQITGDVEIGWIYIFGSHLFINEYIFTRATSSYGDYYVKVHAVVSTLILNDTHEDKSRDVYLNITIANLTTLKCYSSDVDYISSYDSSILGGNITAKHIIMHTSTLNITNSSINEIYSYEDGDIYVNASNISVMKIGLAEDNEPSPLTTTDALIEYSNITSIYAFSSGTLRITNSTVDNVFTLFPTTIIEDSTIGIVTRMYKLHTGDINIVSNTLPSGSYTDLLTITDSSVDSIREGLVFQGSNLNLNIENSEYVALVVYSVETNIKVNNSQINITILMADSITINNSLILVTEEETPIVYQATEVELQNTSIVSSHSIYMCPNARPTGTLSGTLRIKNSTLTATVTFIGDYNAILDDVDASESHEINIANSNISIINSEFSAIYLNRSCGAINGSNIDLLIIDDETHILLEDIVVNAIVMRYWQFFGPWYSGPPNIDFSFTRDMHLHVEESTINYVQPMFYHIDDSSSTSFDDGVVSGDYSLKTIYEDSALGDAQLTMIEVIEHAKVSIDHYYYYKIIVGFWVNISSDTEPPEIFSLNSSHIDIELGLPILLCYELHDDSPLGFIVLLNGTYIDNGSYYDGYLLIVDLTPRIHDAGTYNLTVIATDTKLNMNKTETTIVVYPSEPPEITEHPEDTYTIEVGEDLSLIWRATDRSPSIYKIYLNGAVIQEGEWDSDEEISYLFEGEETGHYNVTIEFKDALGNTASHTVEINVSEPSARMFSTQTVIIVTIAVVAVAVAFLITRKFLRR